MYFDRRWDLRTHHILIIDRIKKVIPDSWYLQCVTFSFQQNEIEFQILSLVSIHISYLSQRPEIQHMEVCEPSCSLCIDTTNSCCYVGADVLMAFTIKRFQIVENHQGLSSVWVSHDGIYFKINSKLEFIFEIFLRRKILISEMLSFSG